MCESSEMSDLDVLLRVLRRLWSGRRVWVVIGDQVRVL